MNICRKIHIILLILQIIIITEYFTFQNFIITEIENFYKKDEMEDIPFIDREICKEKIHTPQIIDIEINFLRNNYEIHKKNKRVSAKN